MYLPAPEAELDAWFTNFADLITANPTTYGLLVGDAATIQASVDAWHAAYIAASVPETVTKILTAAKVDAKTAVLATVRPYAQTIKQNAAVLDADKVALGLTLNAKGSKIPAPTTFPLLNIQLGFSLTHVIRYADSDTPDRGTKPVGATGMQMAVFVGPEPTLDPAAAQFNRVVTRQPVRVTYLSADQGKCATYFGRWQNAKGQVGPWSAAVSMMIP